METLPTIRKATLDDCPSLARVQVDSYRTAYAGIFPDSWLEQFTYEEQESDWRQWLQEYPKDILLVAVVPTGDGTDQVIGYALTRIEQDIYPGYPSEVLAIHVNQDRQGQGVGAALLQNTAVALQTRGCPAVMLWTLEENPARKWYEKLGGKQLAEKSNHIEDLRYVEIAYGWDTLESLLPPLGRQES